MRSVRTFTQLTDDDLLALEEIAASHSNGTFFISASDGRGLSQWQCDVLNAFPVLLAEIKSQKKRLADLALAVKL